MLQHKSKDYKCYICPVLADNWNEAMHRAWRTFMEYESADYTDEGIENFRRFVSDDKLRQLSGLGLYDVYAAYVDGNIAGMISLRNGNHISLLFVDGIYHRRGIGRALVGHLLEQLKRDGRYDRVTVDAAPYGIEFYHRLGFADISSEQCRDGIIYTPMERKLDG